MHCGRSWMWIYTRKRTNSSVYKVSIHFFFNHKSFSSRLFFFFFIKVELNFHCSTSIAMSTFWRTIQSENVWVFLFQLLHLPSFFSADTDLTIWKGCWKPFFLFFFFHYATLKYVLLALKMLKILYIYMLWLWGGASAIYKDITDGLHTPQ